MRKGKVPLTDVHAEFVKQMNYVVRTKRLTLQTEERGNEIAKLQGYCAGFYTYKRLLEEAGYDESSFPAETETAHFFDEGCDLTLPELRNIKNQTDELKLTEAYTALQERITAKVESQKNRLFFESEKGRDLFWSKGWYESVIQIKRWIDELDYELSIAEQKAQKAEKEKKEMLPFDDEE